jgi:hypothetical protein
MKLKINWKSYVYFILIASFCFSCKNNCERIPDTLAENSYVMKINIDCEFCFDQLKLIENSKFNGKLFISSDDDFYKLQKKIKPFLTRSVFLLKEEEAISLFENNFVNTYPTYYKIGSNCTFKEVDFNELINITP